MAVRSLRPTSCWELRRDLFIVSYFIVKTLELRCVPVTVIVSDNWEGARGKHVARYTHTWSPSLANFDSGGDGAGAGGVESTRPHSTTTYRTDTRMSQ